MRKSEPIEVLALGNHKKVFLTFIHTDQYTVLAEITSDGAPGTIRLARNTEDDWIPLEDTLDRVVLTAGTFAQQLTFDIERVYSKYTTDHFTQE